MNELPRTIKHPNTFLNSPAAGFDGVFDWSWTKGCFSNNNITPMDIDGMVERRGHFLVFETKGVGVPVPKGQLFTFESLYATGNFTIIFIEGKNSPERAKVWCESGFENGLKMNNHSGTDAEKLSMFVKKWYNYANSTRKVSV